MAKLPESYVRLKKYSLLVEEICKDVNLQGHGFDPGVLFVSDVGSLDLPEWFLKRLYDYVSAQPRVQPTSGGRGKNSSKPAPIVERAEQLELI